MKTLNNVTTVAKINNVNIVVIDEKGEKRVAVKPICDALGISHQKQFEKIKNDPILGPVVTLRVTTGADKKRYEMLTIPYEYVFGWIFTINPMNVKEDAREAVIKYKRECYHVLYDYIAGYETFVEERQKAISILQQKYNELNEQYLNIRKELKEAESNLSSIRNLTYDEYRAQKAQLTIDFKEGGES